LRYLKSLYKVPISETVQDIVTIADHSKIVCPLSVAVIFISLVPSQPQFVDKVEGVRAATSSVPASSYVRTKVCMSATSFC